MNRTPYLPYLQSLPSVPSLPSALRCALVVMAAAATMPALAVLSNPVTVKLIAPGGPPAGAQVASVDPAVGLLAGMSGNPISSVWMLPGEAITFVDNSIRFHVAAGEVQAGKLVTGYLASGPDPARYQLEGLLIPGFNITGVQAWSFDGYTTSGSSGLADANAFQVSFVGPNRIDLRLDNLVFRDRGGGTSTAFAEFRVDLLTTPVPEPATWALWLLGLAAVAAGAQRRRGAA